MQTSKEADRKEGHLPSGQSSLSSPASSKLKLHMGICRDSQEELDTEGHLSI